MQKFIAEKPQKLKDFTDEKYPQGSFAMARLLRARDVRVNGNRVDRNVMLAAGDEVVYYTTAKEEEKQFYREVYRDENILVVDKFSGVNSEALFFALRGIGVRPVHRLDRNTSGLLCLALNEKAERCLLSAFRDRRIDKIYEAICFYPFKKESARLEGFLRKDEKAARVFVFNAPQRGALPIRTDYRVLRSYGEYSKVEIILHSGKTHQIRAHMAYVGHPVAGDEKYGCERLNSKYGVRRQLLVAKRLCLHTGGVLSYLEGKTFVSSFQAELPVAAE